MRQRTHGIKGVSRVPGAGCYRCAGGIQIGVGMPEADAHSEPRCIRDHFGRSGQLWSDRHNAIVTTSRLPETSKSLKRWRHQVLRWTNAATCMTNKEPLALDCHSDCSK